MKKTIILVAGMGGVGGYYGGLLAKHFYAHDAINVCFFARGENLNTIKKSGLKVNNNGTEFVAKPHLATANAADFGIVDYVLVSCKTYDLEEMVSQLKPAINLDTVIVPLQNGIDSTQRIQKLFPQNLVANGCVYLVSRLEAPGEIVKKGIVHALFFGVENQKLEKLNWLQNKFLEAGIEATLTSDIQRVIWEKFIFLSAMATCTTYFNDNMGNILTDVAKKLMLEDFIDEGLKLAALKQIKVSSDLNVVIIKKLGALPKETTSSMHSDFQKKGKKTELESLTGYMVNEASRLGIALPTFNKAYKALK